MISPPGPGSVKGSSSGVAQISYACLGVALGQSGLFIALPSLPAMASDFQVSAGTAEESITAYALGYGFSQLVWGPLADRFGRRPIALCGVTLFMLASLGLALVPEFGTFLLLRLLQGVAGGCGTSVSRACLRDVFSQRSLAQAMSVAAISYALALGIAPFLGGWLASVSSWRADFVLLTLLGSLALAYLARELGETLPPVPSRASTVRRELAVVLGDYGRLLRDRRFLLPALIVMLATGVVAGYAAASPFDFEQSFGYSAAQFGNLSLSLSGAYLVGSLVVRRTVVRLGQQRLLWIGLAAITAGALVMLALGLAGRFDPLSLLGPMLVVVAGGGMIVPIGLALPMQAFPAKAGQASALTGFMQQEGTAALVALVVWLPDTSQVPLALSLLALALILATLLWAYSRVDISA
ncbi:MAG: multidrug effflux MFS transporter [Cyanobacteria bacterium]|nr:multidrug effflux MFS transporter [Cyanobacteria bacterium bin.51]